MIKNPWKLEWKPPEDASWDNVRGHFCTYSRFNLVCNERTDRDRRKCQHCFMKQQGMSFKQMLREHVQIERVCDRCRAEIVNPDTILYLELEDRGGRTLVNMEICRECGAELADWLNGYELPAPEVEDQLTDEIWD